MAIRRIISIVMVLTSVFIVLSFTYALETKEQDHVFTDTELAAMGTSETLDSGNGSIRIKDIEGLTGKGTESYYIVLRSDGYLLTSPSNGVLSKTRYSAGNSNNHMYQIWRFTESSSGVYYVDSNTNTSKCLTVNPSSRVVTLSSYSGSQYQKWSMHYSSTNGNYLVSEASDTSVNGYKLVINTNGCSVSNTDCTYVGFFKVSTFKPITALSYEDFFLAPRQERMVIPTITPSDASYSVAWLSFSKSGNSISVSGGTVVGNSIGTSTLTFKDKITQISGSCTVRVTAIPYGSYYIENRQTLHFADINNRTMSNGNSVVQWDGHFENSEKWIVQPQNDGYYTIKSANSNTSYYLSVNNDSSSNNASIIIKTGSITDGKKWKITITSSGYYKLSAKCGESSNRSLSLGTALFSNGIPLKHKTYTNDSDYEDEWGMFLIEAMTTAPLEGQKKSNWCWAACARMFSRKYYPSLTRTQNNAVAYIVGSESNEMRSIQDTSNSVGYYIGNISGASIGRVVKERKIYSSTILAKFIKNNHPVIIGRSKYYNTFDYTTYAGSGHMLVVTGYLTQKGESWFMLYDPSPVNSGKILLMSYDKIKNGGHNSAFEQQDLYVWEALIARNTSYSSNTINWYFGD